MSKFDFESTKEIEVPDKIVDQVIGQDEAVDTIKKAASQKRHVLLMGEPGTGKSMIGKALAELLPKEKLKDVLILPNKKDENNPKVRSVSAGKGSKIVKRSKLKAKSMMSSNNKWFFFIGLFVAISIGMYIVDFFVSSESEVILQAANRISGSMFLIAMLLVGIMIFATYQMNKKRMGSVSTPNLLLDNSDKEHAPFEDATGLHEGALLGDCAHDPFQSGGLGTPAHERISAGAIHKANEGVLFIDEIAALKKNMQVSLLTAMEEGEFPITGRSERSAGAMVKTEPVPCDFVLVAAGNEKTIKKMHPALRSRIRGSGYEIYMNDKMEDNEKNRKKIARFVAQEVEKDEKIPHFTREAVEAVLKDAKKRAGRKGYITLKLRDLGGLVRVAGDVAKNDGSKYVKPKHVKTAKNRASSLEKQMAERYTKEKKEYQVIRNEGKEVGRVNGLAVIGGGGATGISGLTLPIEASVVSALNSKSNNEIIATGNLGDIAKEAITNVSAIIKSYSDKNLGEYDIHVQFLQSYEGVEGDSASISVAASIVSALEGRPIDQSIAMTGSLSIRGEVLPVGGINEKIEAAKEAGMKEVIIPADNEKDVLVDTEGIKIHPAEDIADVLEEAVDWRGKGEILRKIKEVMKKEK